MTGTVVESVPAAPWVAAAGLLVAVGLVGLGAAKGDAAPAVAALVPACAAAGAWAGRPAPLRITVGEEALEFEPGGEVVRYDEIEGLTAAGGPRAGRFRMHLHAPGGVVGVPARLSVPSRDLYAHVAARLAPTAGRGVPPPLQAFLDEQEAKFGPERVFAYRGRAGRAEGPGWRAGAAWFGAAAGCVLAAALGQAVRGHQEAFAAGGASLAVSFAILGAAVWAAGRGAASAGRADAGLVVSPVGVALTQGGLTGKLRWGEVRAVDHPPRPRTAVHQTAASKRGVGLAVAGAYIVVQDHYDRPPGMIAERMLAYWDAGRGA